MQVMSRIIPCYGDPGRDPHHDAGRNAAHAHGLAPRHVFADSWSVDDVLDELVAEAKAANAAKAAYERHIGRVRELLPAARKQHPELSVVELEAKIERAYDRGTISRYTAEAVGTSKPKGASKASRRRPRSRPSQDAPKPPGP
jgi:hypothetical protein